MRAVLLILILLVVAGLAAIATGFVDIHQTRAAQAPAVTTTREGVAAKGGQTPAFEVQTGQVAIGSREAKVKLPAINVRPAGGDKAAPAAPANPSRQAPPTASPAPAGKDGSPSDTNAVQQ